MKGKWTIVILPFLLLPVLFSCMTSGKARTDVIILDPGSLSVHLELGEVKTEPSHLINGMTEELNEIITLLSHKHGFSVHGITPDKAASSPPALTMDMVVHQRAFTREYLNLNSITLVVTLKREGSRVAEMVYTEESSRSLDSFATLYQILDATFPVLYEEVNSVLAEETA